MRQTRAMKLSAPTSFARLLRFWRKVHDTSQEELALQLDSATSHISRMENGKASPSRDMIDRIADYFALGQRDRAQLLFAAGYAPETEAVEFESEETRWFRRFAALNLHALEPYPAVLLSDFNRILAFNRGWQGMLGNRLPRDSELDARFYFDFLFSSQPAGNEEKRLDVIISTLMTIQQLALLWGDVPLGNLVEELAQDYDLPLDWRRRAAAVEPRTSMGMQLEIDGQWHKFLHASHSIDPLGPAMALGQRPVLMMILLPLQHDLDLSIWQAGEEHPLLCDNYL